ncbi:endonuclease/exonuclease/phosphatase family protein [Burkholderia multivorans]|uniref:endonuclease/exonuclease/phosphatase family protein n=1 Tax=Burkholderia multivorans TaxID=87883 RepID=UPI000277CD0F|nr:endonuclease/exonuclease/phosphatase family protein [Burkholderia multivorans]AJY15144.1 endonuclease/Exonuclease/phosphatase family protein [Burkholderia multivorans ATCC BAA-247]AVR20234.1 endonuclease [Burkholderia multivorans]EJO54955.1 endonuclease/exonuclease/phosphatase family protein [Burkholderia multivorans ATCC BAA-247]MBU9494701.1 endonuclease/exonuclease/phosphatase family protein [Burkholderia multivorans]MCO1437343.1 endonuclease/exonuclease/phosphatase family protein [Burkho
MALIRHTAAPPEVITAPAPPAAAPGGRDLRIATYNIHGGYGPWHARAADRIAAVIDELDADVIALQEVPLGGTRGPDVLAHLRDATGMHAAAGPTIDTAERRYGNAVLSRYPIRAARTLDLSFHQREPRGALDADIDCRTGPLRVVATHLGLSARERSAQVQRLLAAFDTGAMPVILLGDINEWFVRGRALQALVTRFRRAPAPRTFPTVCPLFSLDRIWVHPGELLVDVAVHRSARARHASDHYPLVARMRAPQPEPEPAAAPFDRPGTPLARKDAP